LAGTANAAGGEKARATAAYFLMAYVGFSVPVIFTGLIADRYGTPVALTAFGLLLLVGTAVLLLSRQDRAESVASNVLATSETLSKQ
jgi:MFS family permease